jgi:hypothetical protein
VYFKSFQYSRCSSDSPLNPCFVFMTLFSSSLKCSSVAEITQKRIIIVDKKESQQMAQLSLERFFSHTAAPSMGSPTYINRNVCSALYGASNNCNQRNPCAQQLHVKHFPTASTSLFSSPSCSTTLLSSCSTMATIKIFIPCLIAIN